jgi:thioredoxin-related protein
MEKKEYKILLFVLVILLILCAFSKNKERFLSTESNQNFEKIETNEKYNNFMYQLENKKNETYRSLLIKDIINNVETQNNIKNKFNKRMNNIDIQIEKLITPNNVYNGNNPDKYQYIKNSNHY